MHGRWSVTKTPAGAYTVTAEAEMTLDDVDALATLLTAFVTGFDRVVDAADGASRALVMAPPKEGFS